MKRTHAGIAVLLGVAVLTVLIAVPASAATATVTGNITGDPVAPGVTGQQLGFSISVSSKTLQSFTLSPPTGWVLEQVVTGPATGSATVVNNQVVATGLSVSGSGSANIQFTASTGCVAGDQAWTLVAKDTQGRAFGNGTSDLTTNVNASCHLAITTQPTDARVGETITNDKFNPASTSNVTVQVQNGSNAVVSYFAGTVSLGLLLDGSPAGGLAGGSEGTTTGVATFDSIAVSAPNEPLFTDYTLAPTSGTLTGDASDPFDIWQAACSGSGCQVKIRNQNDVYTNFTQGVFLTASALTPTADTNISCAGQTLIFSNSIFVHDSGPGTVTFLKSHVTRADMKAAANNGQAHVQWCVGLPSPDAWTALGITPQQQGDLYVALTPACPNVPDPSIFAPCTTRQYGDGNGGNFTEGWLPGDPVRRT
jgi:hypothetical protein